MRANNFLYCIYLKEEVQGGSQDQQEEAEINAGSEVESLALPPLHYSVVKAVVDKVEDEDSLEMTGGSGGAVSCDAEIEAEGHVDCQVE